MSGNKNENLFAKLAGQQRPAVPEEPATEAATPPEHTSPSPAPVEAKQKSPPAKKKPERRTDQSSGVVDPRPSCATASR